MSEKANNKLSIYADDITISGENVLTADVWLIKQTLFRHGHQYKAEKERSTINSTVEITGVIVSQSSLLLPNRQHQKLRNAEIEYGNARSANERTKIGRKIRGRLAQAKQILAHTDNVSC